MVQAIVFLPLLGAILAGLIAIFGAHARNPERRYGRDITTTGMAITPMRRPPMTTMAMTITATTTTTSPSRRRRVRARPS